MRLLAGCTDLADALSAVPEDRSGTVIERTPGSDRTFTVADVPSMRLREVEIHHADLAAGYHRSAWAPQFAAHVLDGVAARSPGSFTAHATDLGREWRYGAGGPVVSGTAADLAWWLTGRGTGEGLSSDGRELPQIGAW
jgi:maleylpyruvate isomerase